MLVRIKDLEHRGYEFEAADGSLALLIRRVLTQTQAPFVVDGYHVSMRRSGNASICEATVKVMVDGQSAHTVAEGDGPVNALDGALRGALVGFYERLGKVRLTDYKVRVLDSKRGTAAKVRVLVEWSDHRKSWATVGVSDNVIEASWHALVDAIRLELMRLTEQDENIDKVVEDYCWGV